MKSTNNKANQMVRSHANRINDAIHDGNERMRRARRVGNGREKRTAPEMLPPKEIPGFEAKPIHKEKPKKPPKWADKLTQYMYNINMENYLRAQEGLQPLSYGEYTMLPKGNRRFIPEEKEK